MNATYLRQDAEQLERARQRMEILSNAEIKQLSLLQQERKKDVANAYMLALPLISLEAVQ